MTAVRVTSGAGLVCFVLWAGAVAAASGSTVPVTTIAAGETSQIHAPAQVVVRDRGTWLGLWRRHAGGAKAAPAVDFGREMVIALFAGDSSERVTIGITRIVREPDRLVVTYTFAATQRTADAVGRVVAPFHIVRLARSTLPVVFVLVKLPQVLHRGP